MIHFCRRETAPEEDWSIIRIVDGNSSSFLNHFENWVSTPRFVKYIWRYNLQTFPRNILERYENREQISHRYTTIFDTLQECVLELAPIMLEHILKGYGQRWAKSNLVELFANTNLRTYQMEAAIRLNSMESNWNRARVWLVPEWDSNSDSIPPPAPGSDIQDDEWEEDFNFHTEW